MKFGGEEMASTPKEIAENPNDTYLKKHLIAQVRKNFNLKYWKAIGT